jgi:hypothetical protein
MKIQPNKPDIKSGLMVQNQSMSMAVLLLDNHSLHEVITLRSHGGKKEKIAEQEKKKFIRLLE